MTCASTITHVTKCQFNL